MPKALSSTAIVPKSSSTVAQNINRHAADPFRLGQSQEDAAMTSPGNVH
jgi:hypothetical protein